jgi:hypothetical protein
MGTRDAEDETHLLLSSVMDIIIVDTGEQMGMSIQPAIPYGIDQMVTIEKTDILFKVVPNAILGTLYANKTADAYDLLADYHDRLKEQQKEKSKHLH